MDGNEGQLRALGEAMGRAASRFAGESAGTWLVSGRAARRVDELSRDGFLERTFAVSVDRSHWPADAPTLPAEACLVLRHTLGFRQVWAWVAASERGAVEQVLFWAREPLSEHDQELLGDAFAAAVGADRLDEVVAGAGEPLPVHVRVEDDKLVVMAPTLARLAKLTVQLLDASGASVDVLEVPPVGRDKGVVRYEVWRLGRRASATAVRAWRA